MWRHVPPVHSPLTLRAIARGTTAATSASAAEAAEEEVLSALRSRLAGADIFLTNSGTAALAWAITLAVGKRGGVVALPAYACFDLATAVDACGYKVLLYDVDPITLGPDFESLSRVLEAGVAAVIVAHLYGLPVDTARVRAMATATDALVIDDAAQGFGALLAGRPLGAGGALGVLSFGRGKGLTGGGGGGLVVPAGSPVRGVENASPAARSQLSWGAAALKTLAQWVLARPALYGVPAALPFLGLGETTYQSPRPRSAMSQFAVGVLAETITLADAELATRRAHAAGYAISLAGSLVEVPHPPNGSLPSFLRYPVMLPARLEAQALPRAVRRLGIMPGYPISLADLPGFNDRVLNAGEDFSGSRALAQRLVTLPTHSSLRGDDLRAVRDWARAPH